MFFKGCFGNFTNWLAHSCISEFHFFPWMEQQCNVNSTRTQYIDKQKLEQTDIIDLGIIYYYDVYANN